MTREQKRVALARLIDPYSQGAASNEAGEAAGRILAAAYRILPPDWPDDAAVERACATWFGSGIWENPNFTAVDLQERFRADMRAALSAAVHAQGDDQIAALTAEVERLETANERQRLTIEMLQTDVAVRDREWGLTKHALAEAVEARDHQRANKDQAYEERNRLVALLASMFPSGRARTDIPGWNPEWHGAVYIDFPWGQASWHFHDSQAHLFEHLPPYAGAWDGHTTEEKYAAIAAATQTAEVLTQIGDTDGR